MLLQRSDGPLRRELEETRRLLRASEEERRALSWRLETAREIERKRIANDIHDDTLQVMLSVGMRLKTLRHRMSDPETAHSLARIEEAVDLAVERLRNLLFETAPATLESQGLAAALRAHLDRLRQDHGLRYTLRNGCSVSPPQKTRVLVYRICQEALSNVLRHSGASHVEVVLDPRDGGIYGRVTDDGAGFQLERDDPAIPGHLGVSGMRERAEVAGGWFRIRSARGLGTSVEFWVPTLHETVVTLTETDQGTDDRLTAAI